MAGPGEVDPQIKGLTALYVGWLNNCRYTVSHRAAACRLAGLTDEELERVIVGNWADFSLPTQLALRLAKEVTLNPSEVSFDDAPQCIDDNLQDRLKSCFTDPQLVELLMSISVWNALSRFHRVMGFELDMPAPDESIDPARR